MNPLGILFFLVSAIALISAPRRWAIIPLLMGVVFITHGQAINLGGIKLPVFRMLLAVGLFRIIVKGEGIAGGINAIDKLMLALCGWLLAASFFHEPGAAAAGPVMSSTSGTWNPRRFERASATGFSDASGSRVPSGRPRWDIMTSRPP